MAGKVALSNRKLVFCHYGEQCFYCSAEKCDLPWSNLVLDHVIPKLWGGPNALWNLVPCCPRCTSAKGSMPVFLFDEDAARAWLEESLAFREDDERAFELVLFERARAGARVLERVRGEPWRPPQAPLKPPVQPLGGQKPSVRHGFQIVGFHDVWFAACECGWESALTAERTAATQLGTEHQNGSPVAETERQEAKATAA